MAKLIVGKLGSHWCRKRNGHAIVM